MQLVPDHANLRKQLDKTGRTETLIVGGINVGYEHHAERSPTYQAGADHVVINNRDCWERLGRPENMTWISNGVDRSVYRVTRPIEQRRPRVLWTGSDFHCAQTNIKGWNEVLVPLAEKMKAAGIDYSYHRANSVVPSACWSTDRMVDWYNTGTIYLCTSSSEGTPNPALEAASCGCVVVSTPVGNMPELIQDGANGRLVARDADSVLSAVVECQERYPEMARAMQNRIAAWHWPARARQYFDLFRRLI